MTIIAFLMSQTWIGRLINAILDWAQAARQERLEAAEEMADDLQAHARDGATSVELRNSYADQVTQMRAEVEAQNRLAAQSNPKLVPNNAAAPIAQVNQPGGKS